MQHELGAPLPSPRPACIRGAAVAHQATPAAPALARALPRACGLAVLAMGGVVLLGWALDVRVLQSFVPGYVTMKANTALGLTMGAAALLLLETANAAGAARRRAGRVLATLVLLLGAATLAQYVFGVDLGIDQLLFSARADASRTATPGRMAAVTASEFVLVGGGLLALSWELGSGRRPDFRLSQLLAGGFGAIALTALLGYVYGVIPTVGLGQGIQIAMHTALGLVLLAIGIFARQPNAGWMPTVLSDRAGGMLARRLMPVAFLVPLGLGVLREFGSWTRLFGVETGSAFVAVSTMIAFAVVIWRTARALNDADRRREVAERDQLALTLQEEAARARAEAEHEAREMAERAREAAEEALRERTERTQLEAQLQQSQKMEAVGQLAGGIAHDFNNMLAAITIYGEMLLGELDPAHPHADSVREITKAAERAASLTRQLLAFSRKQVLQPKVLDLNAVVTSVEPMLRRLIGEDVEVVTALRGELDPVLADPGQLEQVLMNLAINARDAMPNGGRLMIETTELDLDGDYAGLHAGVEPGRYVVLSVSDTGVGMSDETRARIFEPFFTTKAPGKGTGLGLSTVYGIVKQSGGHVWVYSEPGRGTAFKIYLPKVDGMSEAHAGSADVATRGGVRDGSETILLAEDEDALRRAVRRVLEHNGYSVLEASNGREALRIAADHHGPIDVIVSDVVMPEMGGRELVERLASSRPSAKLLYMSGYTDDDIVRRGVLGPRVVFLQKPFSHDQLVRAVRTALDSAGAHGGALTALADAVSSATLRKP